MNFQDGISGLEAGFLEFLLEKGEELAANSAHLQGRPSAEEFLRNNTMRDVDTARPALDEGFDFSDFQEMTLFHPRGFFENHVDFHKGDMPMLPALMCTLFGKSIGEFLFGLYVQSA